MSEKISQEILLYTKDELNYFISCILQTSRKDAAGLVDTIGKATIAKLTAVGATTGIMGLVATLGTAGTGTAIASLHGAAAASATLAWIGGIVGGGMMAGTVLTGGLGMAVGIGAYKLLSSKARDYDSISERERYFVDSCIILIKYIDEWLSKNEPIEHTELELFAKNSLEPVVNELSFEVEDLAKNLDIKNRVLFRAQVTQGFYRMLNQYEKLDVKRKEKDA